MESLKLEETKLALSNLDEIATYYENKQSRLGVRFAKYYYKHIFILTTNPNIGRSGKI